MNNVSPSISEAEIYDRLHPVFEDVFDQDITLTPEMIASDVEGWDSLGNIRLIVAIEAELSIEFTSAEIGQFANVGEVVGAIAQKLTGNRA